MKKIVCVMLVLAMLLCAAASAEGVVAPLFDAAKELAFNTSNVTLGAEATFTYDGELFKTMHASYKQDDVRSVLSYMLDTPKNNGRVYTGGYTVVGMGDVTYFADTYYGNYVNETYGKSQNTVLEYDARKSQMLSVAKSLAVLAEPLIGIKTEGKTYSFTISDLPEMVDSGIYFLIMDYVERYYYLDMFGLYRTEQDEVSYGAECYYEDYDALVNAKYRDIYGKAYDPDSETDYGKYDVAMNAVSQIAQEAESVYADGYCLIKADGSVEHFATCEELYRAMDYVITDYSDFSKLMKDYYMATYGTELTDEVLDVVIYSPNYELWEAYDKLYNAVEQAVIAKAKQLNPNVVYVYVDEDGNITAYDKLPEYNYTTTTRTILNTQTFAELKSLECAITTDENDKLSAFSGKAVIAVTDELDAVHELVIEFTLTATDYGTTHVNEEFNAEDYGMNIYDYSYEEEDDYEAYWNNLVSNAPKTVSFCGSEYDTQMELYSVDGTDYANEETPAN